MMRRYHYLPLLSRSNVTEMSRVAFLSLEECNLLPQSSCDVTEHIYDILKGEAWEYIAAYRKDIVSILKEWERKEELRIVEHRILREEQEKLYAEACVHDRSKSQGPLPDVAGCNDQKWYHIRNHEKRIRVSLTSQSKMKTILDSFSPDSDVCSFTLVSSEDDAIVVDPGKLASEYNLRCDILYHLELD